jgi:hypothetical protein
MAETVLDQVQALITRVEEQGVEIAELRRAVLSLGSHLAAGGPPGIQPYLAWHEAELTPPASSTASDTTPGAVPNPTSAVGGDGISLPASPQGSPGSPAAASSTGASTPSASTAAPGGSPPAPAAPSSGSAKV